MSNLVLNAGWLGDWFYGIWINLWLLIDNVIYVFINWMYRIFMLVAKVDIFGGGAEIEAITRRIYIIVGIAMLFIFAYNLILLIINPEGKQLGNMAKVVQNAIISIILVTLLPLIFSYLTTIQNHVLESNVIGQVILGTSGAEQDSTNKKAGVKAALDIFSAFYHPEGQTYNSCKSDPSSHDLCEKYVSAFENAYNNDSISDFIWDEDLRDGAKKDKMEYNWIISSIAGGIALWCFVSFALDIGVRVGKLAFYELISPVPVMMRILPNDKMYDKWFKGITSTYISLFVRLAIIYFCMYAITLVPEVLTNMWASNGDNFILLALANVVVIIGILQFAKEAPKLVADLFGGSGDGISFKIGKKLTDNKFGMAGMGAVGAGLGGMASNTWNSWKNNMGKEKGFWGNVGGFAKGVGSGAGGFIGGARRGAVGGYESTSFESLGKNITKSKLDSDLARDERDVRHQARRDKGASITGVDKNWLGINSAIGGVANIGTSIGDSAKSVGHWIAGGSGNEQVSKSIGEIKSANSRLKEGKEYVKGVKTGAEIAAIKEKLRSGETYTFDGKNYVGESMFGDLKKAIDDSNRKQIAKNYKSRAEFVAKDLSDILKSLNDNRYIIGKDGEAYLAKALESAADDAKKNLNTSLEKELRKVINGSSSTNNLTVNWDGLGQILSIKESDIRQDGADATVKRQALYEISSAIDKGMKNADEWNRYNAEKPKDK